MSDDFSRFSPESFEQFVRAVALTVLGPGVTAFGDGPDGGREATFDGEVPYPFPHAKHWSGYGVIQAKYKQRRDTAETDQRWALRQLEKELAPFEWNERRTRTPQYYIFVTNVTLSSTAGGGRDQASEVVRRSGGLRGWAGYDVWDANQLTAFLATCMSRRRRVFIRRAFSSALRLIGRAGLREVHAGTVPGATAPGRVARTSATTPARASHEADDRGAASP